VILPSAQSASCAVDLAGGAAVWQPAHSGQSAANQPRRWPRKLSGLADLYDPLTMPAPLQKAHQELDRAVDRCYRPEAFTSDRQRVEYLCTRSLLLGSAFGPPTSVGAASRRTRLRPLRENHRPASGGGEPEEEGAINVHLPGARCCFPVRCEALSGVFMFWA
jgi:hypothetical protein